jgi:signal transduction histidine kinase
VDDEATTTTAPVRAETGPQGPTGDRLPTDRREPHRHRADRSVPGAGSAHRGTVDAARGIDDRFDRVAAFAPAILAIRWGTTLASLALATQAVDQPMWLIAFWCTVVVSYTVVRTIVPLQYRGDLRSLVAVVGEVALFVATLLSTGYWESPFILTLLTAVSVAGFARGFGFGLRVGLVAALAVSLPWVITDPTEEHVVISGQWTLVLLLVALIAGYARRISGEADRQHSLALDRLGRLADANALLFSLHRVAQTLPASLDLGDVLDTTMGRLRGLFDFDAAVILAYDDTDHRWEVLRREGLSRYGGKVDTADLPAPVRATAETGQVVNVASLPGAHARGLTVRATSGLYAVLSARGSTIGLLALEDEDEAHFGARDVELLKGFVEPVALAIDNARWFARLRTVGADEERTRIARDLHDRIGQSLAYLAFELDRIVTTEQRGDDVGPALEQLRTDVRGVIGEVRDTLYDLRTDVTDVTDMASALEAFARRVGERSGIDIELTCDQGARLPLLQEREMWRIAQEAITNVERHAKAASTRILWRCDGRSADLEVTDDGDGFPIGHTGRLDSYGIVGMRERASSIGATIDIASQLGEGTRVRCTLVPVPPSP